MACSTGRDTALSRRSRGPPSFQKPGPAGAVPPLPDMFKRYRIMAVDGWLCAVCRVASQTCLQCLVEMAKKHRNPACSCNKFPAFRIQKIRIPFGSGPMLVG